MNRILRSFINDLKKPVSLLALVVSALSLVFSISNQREQDRRWDAEKLGRIDITDEDFVMFKEMNAEEASKTTWGFEQRYYYPMEGRVVSNKVHIPCELVFWDPVARKPVNWDRGYFTVADAKREMKRLKLNPSSIMIYRHYRVYFQVKNNGATPIENVSFSITSNLQGIALFADLPINEKEKQKLSTQEHTQGIEYLPGKVASLYYDFYLPLDKALPQPITFDVVTNYDDTHNNSFAKTFSFKYNYLTDSWEFIPPQEPMQTNKS